MDQQQLQEQALLSKPQWFLQSAPFHNLELNIQDPLSNAESQNWHLNTAALFCRLLLLVEKAFYLSLRLYSQTLSLRLMEAKKEIQ